MGLPVVALIVIAAQAPRPSPYASADRSDVPDSQSIARHARRAQVAFEVVRRDNLPREFGPGRSACEERIGRFCHWDDETDPPPPAEPDAIRRKRDVLLATLDSTQLLLPADGWISGQRVRYKLEAGRTQEALEAAQECRAGGWWCAALTGLVLHESGDFSGADSAFQEALAAMEVERRCRWTDLSLWMEGRLLKDYRRLDCDARAHFEKRFWLLARPLYLTKGNDLRTEHFARRTMVELLRDARNAFALPWSDDQTELVVRYGWNRYWTEDAASPFAESDVIGHSRSPGQYFLASWRAMADPSNATPSDWDLAPRRPRTRYAPAYAMVFRRLEPNLSQLRRGDSTLTVAAIDLSADTLFSGRQVTAALVLVADEDAQPIAAEQTLLSGRGFLAAVALQSPYLVSVEALASDARAAARARFGLPAADPDTGMLSDLLFFEPDDHLPMTLPEVMASPSVTTQTHRDKPLGLYWEMYGLDPAGESVTVSVAAKRANGKSPIRMQWTQLARPVDGVAAGSVALDLSRAGTGWRRIEVHVVLANGSQGTSARSIRIVE